MTNIAFIDGQNLHLGTDWPIDYKKLRIYLKDKYKVETAYYFLGYVSESQQSLYEKLQRAGFIVSFKEHNEFMKGEKKGNVDSDIIFEAMKKLIEESVEFEQIILVSGDGDYKKLVDYLIKKDRFAKILFPNRKFASSLYKKLGNKFFATLGNPDIRMKLEYKKEKGG